MYQLHRARQRADGWKNVRKSSRLHKRCGTSFLLFVMLVSIVLLFVYPGTEPAVETWTADSFDSCDRRNFL